MVMSAKAIQVYVDSVWWHREQWQDTTNGFRQIEYEFKKILNLKKPIDVNSKVD